LCKLAIHLMATVLFSIWVSIVGIQSVVAAVPDNVQAVFINNTCLNCHSGNNPSGALSLDDATISENALVDIVARCSNNNSKLVDPGDPEASVLYIKLASQNPNCGGVMPPNGQLINAADLNVIYDWIVSIGPAAQFGLFVMADTDVTVQEIDNSVTIIVNRTLGTQGVVTVDYSVSTVGNDTATSPTDYVAQTGTLTFAEGEDSKEILVDLVDDDAFEGSEVFSVTLSNPMNGAVLGGSVQTKINITDNEFDNQPGTFLFSRVSYSVNESDLSLDVTVLRSFGAGGQVSVDLTSTDGSATAGSDFQAMNQTIIFDEGVKNQTVTLTILDDNVEESSEVLTLSLSNPGNGALLGSPSNVTLTINDDDAPNSGEPEPEPEPQPEPDPIITPAEEAEFEAAGSLSYLLFLMLLVGGYRKLKL